VALLIAACSALGPSTSGSSVPPTHTPSSASSPMTGPGSPVATTSYPSSFAPVVDAAQVDGVWWVWDAAAGGPKHVTLDAAALTWRLGHGRYPGIERGRGTFTFAEGVLTWQEGWFDCAADAMGSYDLMLSADARWLTFLLVGDECQARQNDFATWPTWQRGLPPT
jgi:hypothetical protein